MIIITIIMIIIIIIININNKKICLPFTASRMII